MESHAIADVFLLNRAEMLPADVSNHFIVPPFFGRISIFSDKKSVRIVGGRGCGKTMFIRFFCYPTLLSPHREHIAQRELSGVGLYWRPDTGFSAMMKESWLGEFASLAFQHYATLVLLEEFGALLDALAGCALEGGGYDARALPIPGALRPYFPKEVQSLGDIHEFAEAERAVLEMWVQNPRREKPTFLSYPSMLQRLADYVAKSDPRVKHLFLRVFVDEFENLQPHQRRMVCDAIKHPHPRFSVNFAMRRDAVDEFLTSGNEQIAETHDYRTIDIENELSHSDEFDLVAAEMLLLHLAKENVSLDGMDFDPSRLSRMDALPQRLDPKYRASVLKRARAIFPELSTGDIAKLVFNDESLKRRLTETIQLGLDFHQAQKEYKAESFLRPGIPEASIVSAFVLNRKRSPPAEVLRELDRAEKKEGGNRFDRTGGWVDNNLHGALFYLYIGLPLRPNLLYSGFDRFCLLSRPNLRFFQELCHGALLLQFERRTSEDALKLTDVVVHPDNQVAAAVGVSERLFRGVVKLGVNGHRLHEITKRLGKLFETAHRRRSQSEPEINHFSIDDSDKVGLSAETSELLREARIWSVLYEYPDTKNKGNNVAPQTDLVPNPIFSPHFRISYRKRRKITLKAVQINAIFTGTAAQFEAMLKDLSKQWDIAERDQPTTGELF